MWTLQCDGDALGGLRIWLKPGSRCVLGRTKSKDVRIQVENRKSISRSHLTIDVDPVKEGDGVKLIARSTLRFTDNNTSRGTRINGEEIQGKQKIITEGNEIILELGKYQYPFRVKWRPVVLSISLSSKERKDKNVLVPYSSTVEAFDVKTISVYHTESTHAVAAKRNTAMGLQALVNNKYIVTKSYLEAIAEAATAPKGQDLSPLEQDFDKYWPLEENFLPPPANEPVRRPPEVYRQNSLRHELFSGWTFFFFERVQYENFLGPITDAHGKLEMFTLEPGKTRPEDVLEFVGKRGQGGDVALVRFRGKKDPEWEDSLARGIQRLLGYRMLEQNAFLDIILTCDKSALCQPLDDDYMSGVTATQTSRTRTDAPETLPEVLSPKGGVKESHSSPPPSVPLRRRPRARTRQPPTMIDPFSIDADEALPPPSLPPPTQTQAGQVQPLDQASMENIEIQSRFDAVSQAPTDMSVENMPSSIPETMSQSQHIASQNGQRGNKRSAGTFFEDPDQNLDVMDMLPGTRYVKRRKQEEEEERARRGEDSTMLEATPVPDEPTPMPEPEAVVKSVPKGKGKRTTEKPEDPFVAKARELRARDEAVEQKVREAESAAMEGVDIDSLKNLAIIDVMQVRPRKKPIADPSEDHSNRWDEKWNGRKNFKRFRRAGRGSAPKSVKGTVMISMVEHKGPDYGIGDGYWLDNEEHNRPNQPRQLNQDQDQRGVEVHELRSPSRDATSRASQLSTHASTTGKKRAATPQTTRTGAKKQRMLHIRTESESDEDDSDDDLKFRFKKR